MKNNKINIEDAEQISLVQKKFNSLFPNLQLEFYVGDFSGVHPPSKKIIELDGKTLRECRNNHNSGVITIFPEMSVLDLENIFFQSFGISLQVLRKAGNIWQQTSHTDSWSLDEQNRQGEIISSYMMQQEEKRHGQ